MVNPYMASEGASKFQGYKGTFIAHCRDKQDGYAELNLKKYKSGWQKAKPVERVYVKYDQKNNLPTHEATIPNQIDKKFKVLTSAVCITN